MTITIQNVQGTELYCHYRTQTEPQDCFVELDCREGHLRATYNGEIGNAVPFAVWHHHAIRWGIPALKADAANRLLAAIAPLAERVCAGYESVWDGNNHVGRYDESAQAAIEEIEALVDDVEHGDDQLQVWDAADYLASCPPEVTVDTDLDELENQLRVEAEAEGIDVLEGLGDYLEGLKEDSQRERTELLEEIEDEYDEHGDDPAGDLAQLAMAQLRAGDVTAAAKSARMAMELDSSRRTWALLIIGLL